VARGVLAAGSGFFGHAGDDVAHAGVGDGTTGVTGEAAEE